MEIVIVMIHVFYIKFQVIINNQPQSRPLDYSIIVYSDAASYLRFWIHYLAGRITHIFVVKLYLVDSILQNRIVINGLEGSRVDCQVIYILRVSWHIERERGK
jgi:hypothetical protein